jgi:fermentation-respiration switch protein FrsA (DUF1100 family)
MNTATKVPTRTILAAVVMLAGVLVMAFGYYGEYATLTTAGLIVTLAGVLLELVFTTLGGRHREAARMK